MKSEFDKWHEKLLAEGKLLEANKLKVWEGKLGKAHEGLTYFHKQLGKAIEEAGTSGADKLFVRAAKRLHKIMETGIEKVGQISKMIAKATTLAEKIRGRHSFPIEAMADNPNRLADLKLASSLDRYAVSSKVIFDMQASGTRWTADAVDSEWFKRPFGKGNEGTKRTATFFRDLDKTKGRYVGVSLKEYHDHRHNMWQLENRPDAMRMGFDVEALEGRLKGKRQETEPAADPAKFANVKFMEP